MQQGTDLTSGNVYKILIKFAVPFLLANFVQALYGAVDMAVIGWFSNAANIAAVSISTQIMMILNSLVSGLTMGGTILIAQYIGAKKRDDASESIGTMLTLFLVSSIAFTAAMQLLTSPMLKALQTPAEAFEPARQYVLICSFGILFIFGYNAISSILRGMGDSKSPLIFISIACVVNIILDIFFVGALTMGAAGAALATVISQSISLTLAVLYLHKHDFIFEFRVKNFKINKDKAVKILKLGLPVSLQETILSISFLFITAIINTLGVIPSAAVGIAGKFESFAMLPATAFSGAISAIAAQNIGANQPERAKKSLNASIILSFSFSLIFFIWAQISPESVMYIFKADPAVTAAGAQYLKSFSFDFMLVAFGFCLNGFFNGCGCTTFAMINGILASVFIRVPLAYVLTRLIPQSLFGIGAAAPLATLISVTIALIYIRTGKWKQTNIN